MLCYDLGCMVYIVNNDPLYLRNKIDYFCSSLEIMHRKSFSYEEIKEAWRQWSANEEGGWMKVVPFVELTNPAKLLPYLPVGRVVYSSSDLRTRHNYGSRYWKNPIFSWSRRISWSRDQY